MKKNAPTIGHPVGFPTTFMEVGVTDQIKNAAASAEPPLLEVNDLKKHFPLSKGLLLRKSGKVYAVDGVSFHINQGETLGLVGESGCGKSTVGRTVLRLLNPTDGSIKLNGRDITHLSKTEMRPVRREMQIIFQDPYSSLNPRMTAGGIVEEMLRVHGIGTTVERKERAAELFERVGLRKAQLESFPHEFSGGQRQRICIARALASNPSLLVCDEPTSSLDVTVQAKILNLLHRLRERHGLAMLFITHDLGVARAICDQIAVMDAGRIIEEGAAGQVLGSPTHAVTRELVAAAF